MPVEPDVIQHLRGGAGRRIKERTSRGRGHSGRRKEGMVIDICRRYCADD